MMFSKTLALVKDNIRVNCVNPGLIQTPDWVKTAKELTGQPSGDLPAPRKLADFFVFLYSDKATYSVGSTYFVDGGMLKTV